ncbi:ATP-binding protein [Lysinibacter cavernae]|uniref:Signal transduction histidine kinase/phage shock protein PspC (Stress-responsive transcriptional regulator) n=1 Tax=Lysinibacter cavernae TaxID=1640652 RepID=A0A7X5R471_9MICO|nr:ATP-binding protein [Lysinibacter cavernae]NIH55306.1 signal transduction histidine kinase/phage shock protein PspC (stress-responsive transcriptional regulator) [Lysinibacter cavernae]
MSPQAPRPTLVRPRVRIVGGVCAGLAAHLGVPVGLIRTIMIALAAAGGAGVALYCWLWATTPTEGSVPADRTASQILMQPGVQTAPSEAHSDPVFPPRSEIRMPWQSRVPGVNTAPSHQPSAPTADGGLTSSPQPPGRTYPVTEILLGLALLAIGLSLLASRMGVNVPLAAIIPAVVVCVGVALAWWQFYRLRSDAPTTSSSVLIRTLGALVLVAFGILLFFVTGERPNVWTVVVAAFSVLLGVAVVIAPWLIRLTRELSDERAARARATERAEIAAHLHDSVLQTLALIQQKSGAQSDIARIARAQERELRGWLFAESTDAVEVDLADEIRQAAASIEADFAVHFDIVVVGTSLSLANDSVIAAARESMLNAARHAGGSVSVYVETRPNAVEVSVIDRGPGFTLETVGDDRHGVRESIIGRMARAGGNARIGPGRGGVGTEVLLTLPLETPRETPAESDLS